MDRDRRRKRQPVGAGDRGQPVIIEPPHPRDNRAVLAADDQLHSDRDPAALTADDPHEVGAPVAAPHAVD
jgi:hypothetical protein